MRARPRSCETRLGGFVSLPSRLGCSARRLGSARSSRCFGSSVARRLAGRRLGGSRVSRRRRRRLRGCVGGPAARIGRLRRWAWPSRRSRHQRSRHAHGFRDCAGAAAASARPQRPRWPLAGRSRAVRLQRPFAAAVRGGRSRRPFAAAVRGGRSRRPFTATVRGALRGSVASAASMTAPGQVRSLTFSGFQAPQARP